MEILEYLFGGAAKVRLLKLFLLNPEEAFDASEIRARTKISPKQSRGIVIALKNYGFLKQRTVIKERKHVKEWQLKELFSLSYPLVNLLSDEKIFSKNSLVRRFEDAGRVKLIITAGTFLNRNDGVVDLLVVGDALKSGKIESIIGTIEADTGKEVRYAIAQTEDFLYRLSSRDRFVRDILDYPHEIVMDKLGLR